MCGINGMLGSADRETIQLMNRAMQHRGPDDEGTWADARHGVALGHRRLSILDVSTAAHQPMSSNDGRYSIVFNGEIYNFAQLRQELEARGARFRSSGDTEVLLAAYAEWGEDCLGRLRGMFAFAIFDRGDGAACPPTLFLARDRLGIKPLYYTISDGIFLFASEIKALLASGRVARLADRQALVEYLSLGAVAQPRTIVSGVSALMPGHCMRVRLPLEVGISRYWDIASDAARTFPDAASLDAREAALRLRALLEEATRLHMLADVPVGAFLSGGIDSTAIVGLMSRMSGQRIETFSVGFESAGNGPANELPWARVAARAFDTRHTEVIVTPAEVAAGYDGMVHAIDQPSLDGTNTYLVSRAAGSSVKVSLSGLGGDELFAGYPHFSSHARLDRWDRRLAWMGERGKRMLRHVPGRLLRDKHLLLRSKAERYATLRNLCSDEEKHAVAGPDLLGHADFASLDGLYDSWSLPQLDSVARTSYVEVSGYLVNTLLRDVDAMAMAHSLEVRPILLDHVVAEFAFALPAALKLDKSVNKPVLVNALRDVLPEEIVQRKKSGFELPLSAWLAGPLKSRTLDAFTSPTARNLFSDQFRSGIGSQLSAGVPHLRLWAYLMLIEWLNAHRLSL